MTNQEFSDEFDVLYNNITSNQAPGLDEYEKSVFLTRALDEILKSYFDPKLNKVMEGFDGGERRQIDFSMVMANTTVSGEATAIYYLLGGDTLGDQDKEDIKDATNATALKEVLDTIATDQIVYKNSNLVYSSKVKVKVLPKEVEGYINSNITLSTHYTSTFYKEGGVSIPLTEVALLGIADNRGAFDTRRETTVVSLPLDVLMILNELVEAIDLRGVRRLMIVTPIHYSIYNLLMSKPFKRPTKNQVWRLLTTQDNTKKAELILGPRNIFDKYSIRYIKRPRAIRLIDFTDDGVTIGDNLSWGGTDDGMSAQECELDPILHPEILLRAVELAKAAYAGDLTTTVALGNSSLTPIGAVTQSKLQ